MPMTIAEIVTATRELPTAEREELCRQIAESLDAPLTVEEAAWAETAERRAEELRSGQVKGIPADEVFAKARQRLGYLKAWVSRFNSVTSSASVGR